MIRQAVILAGGRGLRLGPLTDTLPKPMMDVGGRPFLMHLIDWLENAGVSEVVLLLGYLADKVVTYFDARQAAGLSIRYSIGDESLDTAARLAGARDFLDDEFLLLYGDNYCPVNLADLVADHRKLGTQATVTVYGNRFGVTTNNMTLDDLGYVVAYDKRRQEAGLNTLDIGYFVVNRELVESLSPAETSLSDDVLPRLIADRQLAGHRTEHRYYSIGTPEKLDRTRHYLCPRRVVLLDRDGVINRKAQRGEYITQWSSFEFLPGAVAAMQRLAELGCDLHIVTNQAGVARGMLDPAALTEIHARLRDVLCEAGVTIADVYHCPHHWDAGCWCRKPNPGMLFQAAHDHDFDLTQAIFVGDDERDAQAGARAGCKTLLVPPDIGLQAAMKDLEATW